MRLKWHILVVDDDPQIGELIKAYLEQHDYRVSVAKDAIQMRREMKSSQVDLVVLDVMLPGEDGVSVCRRLREQGESVLVIMLSAMGDETDRIVGLEVGADDYLAKPFSPRELLARIKTLERLTVGRLAETRKARAITQQPLLCFASWRLDQNKRQLVPKTGPAIPLSGGEYDLLLAFLENPRRVLTREQLLDITRNREATAFDRTIDVQVGRLRKKIEANPKEPLLIITKRGGGYEFHCDVTVESLS